MSITESPMWYSMRFGRLASAKKLPKPHWADHTVWFTTEREAIETERADRVRAVQNAERAVKAAERRLHQFNKKYPEVPA